MNDDLPYQQKERRMNRFENLMVRWFPLVTGCAALALVGIICSALLIRSVTLDHLSKLTDTLLKALAVLVGALWSLNRYFTTRTDQPQLRVEVTIDSAGSECFGQDAVFGILAYRLDINNTGKVLLPVTGHRVEVAKVLVNGDRVLYERLHESPAGGGLHPSGPIEPGSWRGISDAIACPNDVRAVRIFLEIHLEKEGIWTWHRILTVIPANHEKAPALDAKEPATS